MHFLDYWRIIRIRKTVILAVFLLVVVTATIVTFILPVAYSSMASMEVDRDVTDVGSVTERQTQAGYYDPYFIQTEFEVIQSQSILDKVIDKLNLVQAWKKKYNSDVPFTTSEIRMSLRKMIDLRPKRNTSIIEITVYDDDKDEAARIANTIAEVYRDYRTSTRLELTAGGIKAFESEMAQQDKKVEDKSKEVDELREKLNVVDTDPNSTSPNTGSLGPQEVLRYNENKIDAETRYVQEETMLSKLKELPHEKLKDTIPTVAPDALLSQLLQDLLTSHTRLVDLRTTLGDAHPDVQKAVAIEAKLNKDIDDRVDGIVKGLESKVEALAAVVSNSVLQVSLSKSNDIAVAERSRPYYVAKAELDRLKKFREVLELRKFQESVDMALPRTTVVKILNNAEPGLAPVRPNKPLNIALGIIIGLVVGVGLAFFIEYLDTSVKTIDDVERTLQCAVLGVIPQNVGYLFDEGSESPHAEAYRVLRTNLLFSRKDDKLNTVAVVSAGAGEGKSTTVCNLAAVFAQSGNKILLVDSDLRRPTLHKIMGVSNSLGLTNYLLKQNTLEEVIQTTKLPNLHFLASGKLPSSSLGILSSTQMRSLITELKSRYDFVFFDSPPIMGVSDASILASEVDMTMQVIQYRRYPQPMNIRAKQLIEKVGGNLIGIVLNNINMSQDESYYYYSGYYHDYYSKNEDDALPKNGADEPKEKPRADIKSKF